MMRGLVPEIGLTPGTYQVTASLGSFQIERTVSVQAGKVVSFNPLLDLGELEATIAATADAPPLESASVTLFEDDPDSAQGRREVVRSAATQPSFLLPAGTYYAIARSGNVEQRDSITVKAGERTQRSFLLGTGRLAVSTALSRGLEAAEPVAIRAERVDDPRDATIVNRTSAVLEVAAGRYRIESRFGFANARIEREVEIKAGAREQISLEVPAGRPQLRLIEAARGLPLADVGWDIRDQRGQSVWVGQTGEARPLLLQGRYTARAEFRGRTITRDIDVRAGETRTFDLALPQ
jgi:Ca-activated chloride channel family protein